MHFYCYLSKSWFLCIILFYKTFKNFVSISQYISLLLQDWCLFTQIRFWNVTKTRLRTEPWGTHHEKRPCKLTPEYMLFFNQLHIHLPLLSSRTISMLICKDIMSDLIKSPSRYKYCHLPNSWNIPSYSACRNKIRLIWQECFYCSQTKSYK